MDKLTLEDSFRELIKQRKWYVNSLRSPIQAKYDKATFQKGGKVPEERKGSANTLGDVKLAQGQQSAEKDLKRPLANTVNKMFADL